MTIDSTDNNEGNSFEYRLKEVSNEEIVSILKFREHYQPQAVKAAIREAIKRGIIESIEDLEKEEFTPQEIQRSLFPISSSKSQNLSLFKSLCRLCYGLGIIPLIFGVLQIPRHQLTMGVIIIIVGLSIIYLTYKLEKEKKLFLSQLLLLFNVPAIGYAIYWISSSKNLSKMDIVVTVIFLIIIFYITIYVNKLNGHFNKN